MTALVVGGCAVAGVALVIAVLAARRYRELREALLTAGVLARQRPTRRATRATRPRSGWLPAVGSAVPPDLLAVDTDGAVLTARDFAGPDVVVAFLASSCPPCRAALPEVRAALGAVPSRRPRPVAVLGGPSGECAEYAAALSGVARIVEDGDAKAVGVAATLGVHGNPAVLVLGGGVVRGAGMTAAEATGTTDTDDRNAGHALPR